MPSIGTSTYIIAYLSVCFQDSRYTGQAILRVRHQLLNISLLRSTYRGFGPFFSLYTYLGIYFDFFFANFDSCPDKFELSYGRSVPVRTFCAGTKNSISEHFFPFRGTTSRPIFRGPADKGRQDVVAWLVGTKLHAGRHGWGVEPLWLSKWYKYG